MLKIQTEVKLFAIVIVVCTTFMLVFASADSIIIYNADNFHLWQLLSAHFIHYDWQHMWLNILALALLLYIFPIATKQFLISIFVAIVLIDIYLYFAAVKFYAGFSGLLYVIPGFACAKFTSQKRYFHAIVIIMIFIIYTSLPLVGINISDDIIWQPLKEAHLLGFGAGFMYKKSAFKVLYQQSIKNIDISL